MAQYWGLLGRTYALVLNDVEDQAGNVADQYQYNSTFACIPPVPQLIVTHALEEGHYYLPDQPIIFKAVISNKGAPWSKTYLELGVGKIPSNHNSLPLCGNMDS